MSTMKKSTMGGGGGGEGCCTLGQALMATNSSSRKHIQIRSFPFSFFLKTSLLCGSMLVLLALVAFLSGPLIELDRSPHRFGPQISVLQREPIVMLPISQVPAHVPVAPLNSSRDIWVSTYAKYYEGCSSASKLFPRRVSEKEANGYILISTSGGLNQQRTGITDAVVVAKILNATLVVPELDHTSFWKDSSDFRDIFDVDWFISSVAEDVVIVKELPSSLKLPGGRLYSMRVPRKCSPSYYESKVLPILHKTKAVRLTKFDYRLANKLDNDLQKLRCRVNYHALRFTDDILGMGQVLVDRLKQKSNRYIALHLRFEPDMLAFSGCYYGGGEDEIRELGAMRKRWKTLHLRSPERERRNGKCPLTPEEVGLMLRALGFSNDSHLYVASGEVYGGEASLAPLKALFPNYYTKESLASSKELEPFSPYSSRMAAIDYFVCNESDVFVTNNNGNMARMLAGSRRYFGHKRTIRPNAKKLGRLFLMRSNMTWDNFTRKARSVQKGFMGEPDETRPGRGEFFEYPSACICQKEQLKEELLQALNQHNGKKKHKEVDTPNSNYITETSDENEWEDEDRTELDSNEQDDDQHLMLQLDSDKEAPFQRGGDENSELEEEMPWLFD